MSHSDQDFDDFSSDEENNNPNILISSTKNTSVKRDVFDQVDETDHENEDNSQDENIEELNVENDKAEGTEEVKDKDEKEQEETTEDKTARLKKKLAMVQHMKTDLKHKTGVIYLSSIPPYMKPAKMRQILSRFGQVDRLFLKREADDKHKRRLKSGGNKKTMYEEGWAEFIRKRDAKLCAITLNGNIIGGKKGTFYHDDILNVKYLPGFKWADLTEQIARENDVRQAKLEIDISQANKLNADFIRNVEQSKMIQNIQKSKKRNDPDGSDETTETDHRRNFKQHKVSTNRSDAPEQIKNKNKNPANLNDVLTSLL